MISKNEKSIPSMSDRQIDCCNYLYSFLKQWIRLSIFIQSNDLHQSAVECDLIDYDTSIFTRAEYEGWAATLIEDYQWQVDIDLPKDVTYSYTQKKKKEIYQLANSLKTLHYFWNKDLYKSDNLTSQNEDIENTVSVQSNDEIIDVKVSEKEINSLNLDTQFIFWEFAKHLYTCLLQYKRDDIDNINIKDKIDIIKTVLYSIKYKPLSYEEPRSLDAKTLNYEILTTLQYQQIANQLVAANLFIPQRKNINLDQAILDAHQKWILLKKKDEIFDHVDSKSETAMKHQKLYNTTMQPTYQEFNFDIFTSALLEEIANYVFILNGATSDPNAGVQQVIIDNIVLNKLKMDLRKIYEQNTFACYFSLIDNEKLHENVFQNLATLLIQDCKWPDKLASKNSTYQHTLNIVLSSCRRFAVYKCKNNTINKQRQWESITPITSTPNQSTTTKDTHNKKMGKEIEMVEVKIVEVDRHPFSLIDDDMIVIQQCQFCKKEISGTLHQLTALQKYAPHSKLHCIFCLRHRYNTKLKKDILILSFKSIINYIYETHYIMPQRPTLYINQINDMIENHVIIGEQNPLFVYDRDSYNWFVDFTRVGVSSKKMPVRQIINTCIEIISAFNPSENISQFISSQFVAKYETAIQKFYAERYRPENQKILCPTLVNCASDTKEVSTKNQWGNLIRESKKLDLSRHRHFMPQLLKTRNRLA